MENELKPIPLEKLTPNPLVSILMANYNYADFIAEAIESVLNQTYNNWELIICDDGSTDNSMVVIERYCKQDKRIKLICKDNGGQASALNKAYENSRGEVISILDSDDTFHIQKLEKVINHLNDNYYSGLCIHKLLPINTKGKQISKTIPSKLENGWVAYKALKIAGGNSKLPSASGLTFKRKVVEQVFPIPIHFRSNADAVLSELAQYLTSIISINQPLSNYRIHSDNLTAANDFPTEKTFKNFPGQIKMFEDVHKTFLRKNFGEDLASKWDFTNREGYWDSQLAICIFDREGHSVNRGLKLISKIDNPFRKIIWLLIIMMPSSFSKRAIKIWWSPSILKKYLYPLSSLLNYSTKAKVN